MARRRAKSLEDLTRQYRRISALSKELSKRNDHNWDPNIRSFLRPEYEMTRWRNRRRDLTNRLNNAHATFFEYKNNIERTNQYKADEASLRNDPNRAHLLTDHLAGDIRDTRKYTGYQDKNATKAVAGNNG